MIKTPTIKPHSSFLMDYGIDIMKMEDEFNSHLFAAMERYAEAYHAQFTEPPIAASVHSNLDGSVIAETIKQLECKLIDRIGYLGDKALMRIYGDWQDYRNEHPKEYSEWLYDVSCVAAPVQPVPKEKAIDLIATPLPYIEELLTQNQIESLCKWIDSYLDKYTAQFNKPVQPVKEQEGRTVWLERDPLVVKPPEFGDSVIIVHKKYGTFATARNMGYTHGFNAGEYLFTDYKWLEKQTIPAIQVGGYSGESVKLIALEAAKYGFNYRDISQHHGCVPDGNVLQWLQWYLSSLPPVEAVNDAVDGWISVKDDKPTPFTPVLLCFSKESPGMNNIIRTGRWVGDTFHLDGNLPLLPTFVTHWKYLPEPPKN